MKASIRRRAAVVLGTSLVLATSVLPATSAAAESAVGLGVAGNFAVLAGATVTNTGPSTIVGDIGLHPGSAVDGFPPGTVNDGVIHAADGPALTAKAALATAYGDAAGRSSTGLITADLGGQTLFAGVYTGGALQVTGTLTLDAQGDAGAVFIFQAASSLTTASGSSVSLINGAGACNVFWQVTSSATLGTGSRMVGTVMALTSIWAGTNASIQGRLLARNGEVTLDSNTFSRATCAQVVDTTTTTTTTTTGGGSGGPATTTTTGGGSGGPATTTGGAATTVRTLPGTGSTTDGGFLAALVLIAIGSGMAVIARRSPRGSLR